jgi:hypothetical protein
MEAIATGPGRLAKTGRSPEALRCIEGQLEKLSTFPCPEKELGLLLHLSHFMETISLFRLIFFY